MTTTDVTTQMDGEHKYETEENEGFEVTYSNENNILEYVNNGCVIIF